MTLKRLLCTLIVVFLITACSAAPKSAAPEANRQDSEQTTEGMKPSFTGDATGSVNKDNAVVQKEKIIQTIGLELETKKYSETITDIEVLTRTLNGYVLSSSIPRPREGEQNNGLVAYLSLMIPTDKIDEFILKTGEASNIVNESRDAVNITDVYRDTQSRIDNLKTKEKRLQELMKQSGTLADLLLIETELSNTRYEIEQLESAIKNYDNRLAYTQFNLTVREVYTYTPAQKQGLWERIVTEFENNWKNFVWALEGTFIFIVSTLPFLLVQFALWIIPLALIYALYRKIMRKGKIKFALRKNKVTESHHQDQDQK